MKRVNIPVDIETRKRLAKERARVVRKTGERMTWDQFMTLLLNPGSRKGDSIDDLIKDGVLSSKGWKK